MRSACRLWSDNMPEVAGVMWPPRGRRQGSRIGGIALEGPGPGNFVRGLP